MATLISTTGRVVRRIVPAVLMTACCVLCAQDAEEYKLYYSLTDLPNGLTFLPGPPEAGSPQYAYDVAQYEWGKTQREGERGQQAVRHATEDIGVMMEAFSEPFGMSLSEEATPAIYRLLYRGVWNICFGTVFPKMSYMRVRPYVSFGEPTLVPDDEDRYRDDGSYPSAHTAMGWGMALLLSELNMDAQDGLLALGYEWGQSRVIAGFHWQSDVDAARMAAAACYARLHSHPEFIADMNAAREEYLRAKSGGSGIEEPVRSPATNVREGVYTLQGQSLEAPPKRGIYIQNGQKRLN